MLEHLGVRISSKAEPDGSIYHGTGGFDFEDEKVYNNFGFLERDGVVDSIYIWSDLGLTRMLFNHYGSTMIRN